MINESPLKTPKHFDQTRYRPQPPSDDDVPAVAIRFPEESNDGYRAPPDVVQHHSALIKPLRQEIGRVIVACYPQTSSAP